MSLFGFSALNGHPVPSKSCQPEDAASGAIYSAGRLTDASIVAQNCRRSWPFLSIS